MILIQLQGGMQPVANTKTDAQGHYSFDNPALGAAPMLIRAVYQRRELSRAGHAGQDDGGRGSFRADRQSRAHSA